MATEKTDEKRKEEWKERVEKEWKEKEKPPKKVAVKRVQRVTSISYKGAGDV